MNLKNNESLNFLYVVEGCFYFLLKFYFIKLTNSVFDQLIYLFCKVFINMNNIIIANNNININTTELINIYG